jgi:hypothetical protein
MTDSIAAAHPPRPSLALRYVQVAARRQTWLNLAWILLALPLGIASFTFATTGFSLGLGLAITIIGIPLLIGMTFAARALASLEGRMASVMLGADIPTAPLATRADRPGLLPRISANLRDSLTWRGLLFMFLRLPLGIGVFVSATVLLALVAALIAAPFTYDGANIQIFSLRADTFVEAIACFAVGILMLPATLHALNGLGWLMGRLARVLLAPSERVATA